MKKQGILSFKHFIVVMHIIMLLQQNVVAVLMQLNQKNIKIKKHEANP
jgi:hypothetical protein